MRFVQSVLVTIALISLTTGCATTGVSPPNLDTGPEATSDSALAQAYRQLDSPAVGNATALSLPDGFGKGGVRIVKRYFSASGKRCVVVRADDSGEFRALCRNAAGAVNAFTAPDHMRLP